MKKRKLILMCGLFSLMCASTYATENKLPSILSEDGYISFFNSAITAALNEDVFNPYVYDEFLNMGFRENGFLEQAYEEYLESATGNNLFVDYPTYVMAVLEEDSFMERAYNEFVTIFKAEEDSTSSNPSNSLGNLNESYSEVFKNYISPLNGFLEETSPFGPRSGGMHYGSDVKVPVGTPLFAAEEGIAYKVNHDSKGENRGGGKMIFIKHPDGNETRYMHLDSYAITEGTYVQKGQLIGYTGNTGETVGDGHLHLELLLQGEWIDSDILYMKNPLFVQY